MARITNLMNILISGKVGNMVICNGPVRGSYIRTAPKKTAVRTEKQLSSQNKMALSSKFLNPLRTLIEEVWQKDHYTCKTAYGSACSQLMRNAFEGGYKEEKIIYPLVRLSCGSLARPEGLIASRDGCRIEVSWGDSGKPSKTAMPEDKAILVICNESKGLSISYREKAVRKDGYMSVQVPQTYRTGMLYAYLMFVSRNGRAASDSVCTVCQEAGR